MTVSTRHRTCREGVVKGQPTNSKKCLTQKKRAYLSKVKNFIEKTRTLKTKRNFSETLKTIKISKKGVKFES